MPSRRDMLLGTEMSASHEVGGEEWKQDPLHFLHCLDYMAQVSDNETTPRTQTTALANNWSGYPMRGRRCSRETDENNEFQR